MRFKNILSIYFAIFIIGLVRGILLLLAALTRVGPLAMLYQCLGLNDCLAFAALIIIHVFRFQPSGKFCSGDYFSDPPEDFDPTDPAYDILEYERGGYLLGLIIYIWVSCAVMCLISCIFFCCFAAKMAG